MPEVTGYAAMAARAREDFVTRKAAADALLEAERERQESQHQAALRFFDTVILPELQNAQAGFRQAGFDAHIGSGTDKRANGSQADYLTFTPKIIDELKRRNFMREEPTVRFEYNGTRCEMSVNWNRGAILPTSDITPERIAAALEKALQQLLA